MKRFAFLSIGVFYLATVVLIVFYFRSQRAAAQPILEFLIGSSTISALLYLLGKRIIDLFFQQKIEEYRNDLTVAALEHQVKFSKLHQERADAIIDLYAKLNTMHRDMNSYLGPVLLPGAPPEIERAQTAANSANEFIESFLRNEIFFEKTICDDMNAIIIKHRTAWLNYQINKSTPKVYLDNMDILNQIPIIQSKLKNAFQEMLGIT